MRYIVEISTMSGDGVAEEEYSRFVSSDQLPVPNVGDSICVTSGGGPDYKQAQMLKVAKRLFVYTPERDQNIGLTVHVQLFCQDTSKD